MQQQQWPSSTPAGHEAGSFPDSLAVWWNRKRKVVTVYAANINYTLIIHELYMKYHQQTDVSATVI
jgi:hypothetical protein